MRIWVSVFSTKQGEDTAFFYAKLSYTNIVRMFVCTCICIGLGTLTYTCDF